MNWLIIKDHPLPEGYQVNKADVALLIPPSYPAAEIDMAYFFPALQRLSGRPIGAITTQAIDGRIFQRWSR
ncbi:E2/UBC family protein, partial [Vibrio vulnificus]|uniref:E2/UBC family protein n=1 Tax=Vibrio vulnificus TaxID=672 RepID=UPI001F50E6BF